MLRRALLALCLLLLACMRAKAQPDCTVTHYDEFSGMAQWYVTQIVQDRKGMMWFATWNGLNRYDGYQFECFKSEPGDGVDLPSDRISDIMLNDQGNLFCLIDDRVFLFHIDSCRYQPLPQQQEQKLVALFKERKRIDDDKVKHPFSVTDTYGTQWQIAGDGTITYTDPATGRQVSLPKYDERMRDVQYCTTDRNGNVWARSGYGAYKLTFYNRPYVWFAQEKPSQIRCLYLDSKQRYWVTSKEDATVRLFDRDNRLLGYLGGDGRLHAQYTHFRYPVYAMLQDTHGVFWLGCKPGGVCRLTETADGVFQLEQFVHDDSDSQSISHDHVYDIKEDARGRLWIATFDGGINCVEHPHDAHPAFLHQGNGLRYPEDVCQRVRYIHITADGHLLAATTRGLIVADVTPADTRSIVFKCHTKEKDRYNSLSNNATMYVAEDSLHRLFVCTESGGVNLITSTNLQADQLCFRHFNTTNGLPSDVALSAQAMGDRLLIVSNNQLILLRVTDDDPVECESFFWRDKMRFSDATPLLRPDGYMLFGLQDHALLIRPSDIQKNQFVPPLALTALSIENRPLQRAVNALDTLVLQPGERDFTLWFAALDFSVENQVDYAFRLDDDKWNSIGKNRSATFLDMAPGTYRLQIRSTNADGVWVDNVRVLTIIVKPVFWETGWAKLLYVLLFAAVVWAILYTRRYIKNLNRRQRELHEAYLALVNAQNSGEPQTVDASPSAPAVEQTPAASPADSHQMSADDEMFMRRVMAFIESNIDNADVNISDMAEAAATSYSGLNRKMKSLLGVTPLDFLREARIRRACQLLQEGLPVVEVAAGCGFADAKYFAKCFKAEMGMTPTEYKAKNISTEV